MVVDGGGVRGLSSLLILENLMHRISPEKEIRPCEVFHIIGGTSTGGIIALMLGRLVRLTSKIKRSFSRLLMNNRSK